MLCVLLATAWRARSQNLAPNPGFEAFHHCPPYPGQIHEAIGWDSPNNNTTDYFHQCAPKEDGAGVPENLLGRQLPAAGKAYAGIRTWIPVIPGNPIYREYLAVRLKEPLRAGVRYAVRFDVSLAEESSHASDDLGAFFSRLPFKNERLYNVAPQVKNPKGRLLDDAVNWTTISGAFTALGGEEYLVIGNFADDSAMTRRLVRDNDQPKVYYYVDEVVVEACATPEALSLEIDTSLCAGGAVELFAPPNAQTYQWNDLSTSRQKLITRGGAYRVVSQTLCHEFTTTFNVIEEDCSCRLDIPSPQLLESISRGGRLQISTNPYVRASRLLLFDIRGRLVARAGLTESVSSSLDRLAAGMYFYQLYFDCQTPEGAWVPERKTGRLFLVR